jgi:O-antigen/teichoic acid export membrane protein
MTETPPIAVTASLEDLSDGVDPREERFALGDRSLREHTAKGAIINSLFHVGLAGVGLLRRVAVAAFLTRSEFGFWGLLLVTILTLAWLKQIGINEKYVQQAEADQEEAFQKAFTLELGYSTVYFLIVCMVLPIYAVIYEQADIIVPGIVLATVLLASALQSPVWIAYRQMRFVRQRTLEAVDPVLGTVVTIGLALAGFGYWSLVIGTVAGSFLAAAAALATSPYPIRLRFDRGTTRDYFRFSWPLFVQSASALVVVQGSVIVGNWTVGLAGLGALSLAASFTVFADRVDEIIRVTFYPAVVAVRDRLDLLFEAFEKSNRLALMWSIPFGVGLALYAPDLVHFLLGDRWEPAVGLLQAIGLIVGFRQIAFNWSVFMQATDETRPMAVSGILGAIGFLLVTAPLMITLGLTGYAIGIAVGLVADLCVCDYFLRRLFPGFRLLPHAARACVPSIPPLLIILGLRFIEDGAHRSLGLAVGEFGLYVLATVSSTLLFERRLVAELLGYLRGRSLAGAAAP